MGLSPRLLGHPPVTQGPAVTNPAVPVALAADCPTSPALVCDRAVFQQHLFLAALAGPVEDLERFYLRLRLDGCRFLCGRFRYLEFGSDRVRLEGVEVGGLASKYGNCHGRPAAVGTRDGPGGVP